MKRAASFLVAVALAVVGTTAPAAADSAAQDVAYGAGSVLGTAVYAPFKATFCILGGITSGFTFPFAGADTAGRVATAGCGGTWAITPGVLKGQERVTFVGGQQRPQPPRPQQPPSAPPSSK
jgi:hypothetical protein